MTPAARLCLCVCISLLLPALCAGQNPGDSVQHYLNLGRAAADPALSLRHFHTALRLGGAEHKLAGRLYFEICVQHYDQGQYALAREYGEKALPAFRQAGQTGLLASLHASLGKSFLKLQDQDGALYHFKQSWSQYVLLRQKRAQDSATVKKIDHYIADCLNDLGNTHNQFARYDSARYYYEAVRRHAEAGAQLRADAANNIGDSYFKENRFAEAERSFIEALQLHRNTGGNAGHEGVFNTLLSLGQVFVAQAQPAQAHYWIARAMRYADSVQQHSGATDWRRPLAKAGLEKGAALLQEQKPDAALAAFHDALRRMVPELSAAPETLPLLRQLRPEIVILRVLVEKARALEQRFQSGHALKDLHLALECHHLALAVADSLRLNYSGEDSKYLLGAFVHAQAAHAIRCAMALRQTAPQENRWAEEAWYFSERNHAAVLLEELLRNESPLSSQRDYLQPLSMYELQAKLSPGEAMAAYFWGQESCVAFSIRPEGAPVVLEIPLRTELRNTLSFLSRFFETGRNGFRDPAFPAQALALYETLLAPLFPAGLPKCLIVVPDGPLAGIPFDALLHRLPLATERSFAQYPFLIRQVQLRYAFAASAPAAPKRNAVLPYLGIAPDYAGADSLPGAAQHVARTAARLRGMALSGKAANPTNFAAHAESAAILQFFGHAGQDAHKQMRPYLRLSEDMRLYDSAIYKYHLQAGLAILSACETHDGRNMPGEGVLSLARAFRFAGCPGIVASLWPADLNATDLIITRFSEQLEAGKSYTEALHKARLECLNTSGMGHPYFWSNFVLIGEDKKAEYAELLRE